MLRIRPFVPAVLALMAVAGCGTSAEPSEADGEITDKTITLEVTGEDTGRGHVWIQYTFGGKVGQEDGAKLPWRMSGTYVDSLASPYLVFAESGTGGGDIACRILLDGKPIKTARGEGPDATATCEAPPS